MAGEGTFAPAARPELYFGLVGAVGSDLEGASQALSDALTALGYLPVLIKLSSLLEAVPGGKTLPSGGHEDIRISAYMDAGDAFRREIGRGDAVALLAVARVRSLRKERAPDGGPSEGTAYIFRSLKHPDEAATLRRIYGRAFHQISVYSSRAERVERLTHRVAQSHADSNRQKYRAHAEQLIARDESGDPIQDRDGLGQNVREAFPIADLFVSGRSRLELAKGIKRYTEILFGHPFHTPASDELAMFYAKAAALRSADLSRQVGAVICDSECAVLSTGCNEVPRPGGGYYWADASADHRDFQKGADPSAQAKRDIVSEIVDRLRTAGWLCPERASMELPALVADATKKNDGIFDDSQVMNLLEFGRIVHAEMAALSDAARRGVAIQNATLHCTTFPCHMCARHIVAAGISRVVYIEPYPKSLASQLYPEAISVEGAGCEGMVRFEPFIGISPTRFVDAFSMPKRKGSDGAALAWSPQDARPRLERFVTSYIQIEEGALAVLNNMLAKRTRFAGEKVDG